MMREALGPEAEHVTFVDDGFDDPTAGFLAPRPGIGTGLWAARQLTWRIEFLRSPGGFTTRMAPTLTAPVADG
jgi:hypothetical protein